MYLSAQSFDLLHEVFVLVAVPGSLWPTIKEYYVPKLIHISTNTNSNSEKKDIFQFKPRNLHCLDIAFVPKGFPEMPGRDHRKQTYTSGLPKCFKIQEIQHQFLKTNRATCSFGRKGKRPMQARRKHFHVALHVCIACSHSHMSRRVRARLLNAKRLLSSVVLAI